MLEVVKSAEPLWIFVALGVQLMTYAAAAALFRSLTVAMGFSVSLRRLYSISVAVDFLNNAFPASGASGATFLARSLKVEGIPAARSLLLSTLYYLFNWLSFFALLAAAYLYLVATRPLTAGENALGALALGLGSAFLLGLLVFGRSRNLFVRFVQFGVRVLGRLARLVHRREPDAAIVTEQAAAFHDGFRATLTHPATFTWSAVSAGLEHLLDIVTLGAIFLAFSTSVNFGVLTVGFFLANIVSWISFIPTGLGVFEGSLVAIYTAFGVPFEAAAVSVLVYRALSFWLPIPLGFALYRRLIRAPHALQATGEPVR